MRNRRVRSPRAANPRPIKADRRARAKSASHGLGTRAGGSAATRARILASAERLFAERGFNGVAMPVIAKASGITAGAIYKHFDGKADLFFEIVRRAVAATPVEAAAGPNGANFADVVAGFTTRRLKRVRQLAVEVHYAAGKDPKVCAMLRQSLDRQMRQIEDDLAAEQRADEPARDADLAACSVLVFIMGLMHLETLAPHLVGDDRWHDFFRARVPALLGRS